MSIVLRCINYMIVMSSAYLPCSAMCGPYATALSVVIPRWPVLSDGPGLFNNTHGRQSFIFHVFSVHNSNMTECIIIWQKLVCLQLSCFRVGHVNIVVPFLALSPYYCGLSIV